MNKNTGGPAFPSEHRFDDDLVKRLREDRIAVTQYLGEEAADTIESLQTELVEQCRLNGMGSEREARLMARVEELERTARMAHDSARWINDEQAIVPYEAMMNLRKVLGETK